MPANAIAQLVPDERPSPAWVQRDVSRPNTQPVNPNFLIDKTP